LNLDQVYKKFPSQNDCLIYLESLRWNGIPHCPYCNSANSTKLKDKRRYHCNTCNTSYSVTVGTAFQKTKLDLQKWFFIISILTPTNKISLRQVSKMIGVNKNTGWSLLLRIKKSLAEDPKLIDAIFGDINKVPRTLITE
jgi:transposase-like protein